MYTIIHTILAVLDKERVRRRAESYFSSRTGGRVMRVMRLQYQMRMMRMLGVRKVFMANHTLVKPPFWWMP